MLSFLDDLDAKMMAMQMEFDKGAREGRPADELSGRVWALDQRQLLNTRAWLAGGGPEPPSEVEHEESATEKPVMHP